MTTFQELINTYPPERWVKDGGYCSVCASGTPCLECIICDIADIQDVLESRGLFIDDFAVFTWLHQHKYSSLVYQARQLAVMFLKRSQLPLDAEINSALALAGAHY